MAEGNGGDFVRITNREIYDALVSLKERVQGVEGRLDAILLENRDLRKRVSVLEFRTYAILSGIIGAVPFVAHVAGFF